MKKTLESGYIQHVRKNAEAKKPWAQKAMGDVFYYGIGMEDILDNMEEKEKHMTIEENHEKAFKWYLKAAEQGEPSAMHAVGRLYYFEEGVYEADGEKAVGWYRKAAHAGHAESLYSLAQIYEHGSMGVNQDVSQAEKLYTTAIDDHMHKDSLYPLARLGLNNPEFEMPIEYILQLLVLAKHVAQNSTAAEHVIDSRNLWSKVSPAKRKEIWDEAYHLALGNWDHATQNAVVSGISTKIAVTEPSSKSLSAEEVFNRIWRSVVYIEANNGNSGSGVIVQPDIVATNHHVVRGADKVFVHQPKERSGRESTPYPARRRPVQADRGEDYCLLHVPDLPGSGIPATIRRYDTLKIGETVYALGAPKGEVLSLSKGIISQLRDTDYYGREYATPRAIQSDVGSASGSSGGGLFDSAGYLIGHPTFGSDEKGLEYSIPADIVLEFGKESKTE